MKEITADKALVAYCGLYCGACGKYLSGKCPGCAKNEKAAWCTVRKCGIERGHASCAECKTYADINECKAFNNFFSKLFGLIFRSNRKACVAMIREKGYDAYASYMAQNKLQSLKRTKAGR